MATKKAKQPLPLIVRESVRRGLITEREARSEKLDTDGVMALIAERQVQHLEEKLETK